MSKLPNHLEVLNKSDLESMCVDCGLCCYASIQMEKGNVLIPDLRCKHLSFDDTNKSCCDVYENRHEVMKGWCQPLAKAIDQGLFPEMCPYVQDMQDYVGSRALPDNVYEGLKPQIQKSFVGKGKPEWVSDSLWNQFLDK